MQTLSDSLIVLGMFVLRLGVPLLLTLAVGYALSRLDRKWQAEAEAQIAAPRPQVPVFKGLPAAQVPAWPLTAGPADVAGQPCWDLKQCPELARATCPAFLQPSLACWAARSQAEGHLPAGCTACALYRPAPAGPSQPGLVH